MSETTHVASERAASNAVALLKNRIEAAQNGNQAAENFVCAAAFGELLVSVLSEMLRPYGIVDVAMHATTGKAVQEDFLGVVRSARAAIAKATGEQA